MNGDHCIILSEPLTPTDVILNETKLYYGKPLKSIASLIEIPFLTNSFVPTPTLYADILFNESYQQNYKNHIQNKL